MTRYAERTEVDSGRSRAELERTVVRYGASAFGYGWEDGRAVVQFRARNRFVRFMVPMPDPDTPAFLRTPTGKARSESAALQEYERAVRQRWRALALVVKAKLEAVESGITSFDEEFLAHLVLPDGSTVGEAAIPGVELAYETGEMPRLLPEVASAG
jgi:hypothetical protein